MLRDPGSRHVTTYAMMRTPTSVVFTWASSLLLALFAWWDFRAGATLSAVLLGVTATLALRTLYTASYSLSDDAFHEGTRLVGYRIPLDTIESITYGTREGLSRSWSRGSWGLLIQRRGKRRLVFISPRDHADFLRDLDARCPHLEPRVGVAFRELGARNPTTHAPDGLALRA